MKLEGTIHCEAKDCERHAHVGADTVAAGRLPCGFVRVTWYGSGNGDGEYAFCGTDCLMKWAADFPAATEIPWDGLDR